jgi:threonine/homoserine/homoserine lactone efflux protein
VLLFVILAVSSIRTANKKEGDQKNIVLKNNVNRFVLGFTMSAINPVQIPFWFIWSTYLLSNKYLPPRELHYNVYTAGIGIGTLIALAVFIFAGRWIITRLNASHRIINLIVGGVFILSACIQFYRLVKN